MKPSLTHIKGTGFESGDTFSLIDGQYLGNSRSDWDRFVNDYFLPSDEVWVSDRLTMSFLAIISQLLPLFVGWCIKGFSLIKLVESNNSFLSLNLFLLIIATTFFIFYFLFRITKGLISFAKYKKRWNKEYKRWIK